MYGSVVPISERNLNKFQHQGYGVLLMENAERIAKKEHKSDKIAVISGVGTRQYYRKLGYHLEGPYMVKSLKEHEYKSVFDCVDTKPQYRANPVKLPGKKKFLTQAEYMQRHMDAHNIPYVCDDYT